MAIETTRELVQEVYRSMQQRLDTVDVAILMVSADMLASNYVKTKEIPSLLRRAESIRTGCARWRAWLGRADGSDEFCFECLPGRDRFGP